MLANWTKATTTTTGTGTITLTAVTGFPLPSKSRATGEFVQYSIKTSDGKFESGIGTIAASETLERTRVVSTYDGTTYNQLTASALSLAAGTHDVFLTPMAEAVFEPLRFPLTTLTNQVFFSTAILTAHGNVGTAAAQRATAYPFRLETSGLLTSMGIQVASGGAGSTTLLGLYETLNTGNPGRLLAKTSATIDTSGTGWKTQAVGANVRLTPGWYWAAICVTAGTNPQFTGGTPLMTAFGCAANAPLQNIRSDTAATDLADPFLTTSMVYTTGNTSGVNIPYIGLILS
jgi:hypothetical protein